MPSLKDLKSRKASVQSTKKITSAMKLISAAKLRKAQERVIEARPYALKMAETLGELIARKSSFEVPPKLLVGTGKSHHHWVFVISSNRGLCGSFNGNVGREALAHLKNLRAENRSIKIFCVGKRALDLIRASPFADKIVGHVYAVDKPTYPYAKRLISEMLTALEAHKVDVCTVIYNRFVSAIAQEVITHRLIPFSPLVEERRGSPEKPVPGKAALAGKRSTQEGSVSSLYSFEPKEETLLGHLLPQNLSVQLHQALLENAASEQAARMTAMDGATRNADDVIARLELQYNQMRQAHITKELIEIISGAEAL